MGKIKLVSAVEVVQRLAGFLKELEAQGRFDLGNRLQDLADGQPWPGLGDMILICKSVRAYVFKHADLLMVTEGLPSVLLGRFADLLGDKSQDDKIRASDKEYKHLGTLLQAMQAWCKRYLTTNLFKGRPLGVVPGSDGKLHPTD